jgi:phage-related minor tail protein
MANTDSLNLRTQELRSEMENLNTLADSFGNKLVTSLASAVVHGRKLSDTLRGVALSLAGQALSAGLRPLGNLVGNLFQNITPFASGGIVNSPLLFPTQNGTAMAGENGPEAILPLTRGTDGKLGLRGAGMRGTNITINISTPDIAGFRQSQSQVQSMIARAVAAGQRNL